MGCRTMGDYAWAPADAGHCSDCEPKGLRSTQDKLSIDNAVEI